MRGIRISDIGKETKEGFDERGINKSNQVKVATKGYRESEGDERL